MKLRTILAGAGVLATLALATGATAAPVIYQLGDFTLPHGVSTNVTGDTGAIDDVFDFTILNPPVDAHGQLVDFVSNGSGVFAPGATIGLFTSGGTMLGSLQPIATVPGLSAGNTMTEHLAPGSYYVEVLGSAADNSAPVDYTLGVIGAAVPEPAAWAMMIVGLGLIGSTLRVRARREQGVAA